MDGGRAAGVSDEERLISAYRRACDRVQPDVGVGTHLAAVRRPVHELPRLAHGAPLERGVVYVAPDGVHLGAVSGPRAALDDDAAIGRFRPSATYLLRSLAKNFGARALGVVLTGMGSDGAEGALELRSAGGRVAVQDQASSSIFGMPQAAIRLGAAHAVLPLDRIPQWLVEAVQQ